MCVGRTVTIARKEQSETTVTDERLPTSRIQRSRKRCTTRRRCAALWASIWVRRRPPVSLNRKVRYRTPEHRNSSFHCYEKRTNVIRGLTLIRRATQFRGDVDSTEADTYANTAQLGFGVESNSLNFRVAAFSTAGQARNPVRR